MPRSLYVHVPFCTRRCSYCDFAVDAVREPPVAEWLEAIGREIELTAAAQGWRLPLELDTLYVGGGTPSLLGVGAMAALADRLAPFATLAAGAEWTCEANPESFSAALARDWRAAGVNRVSLGVQSFHPATLRWMGRLHGPEGARSAIAAARAGGLENVSLDLIFALPDELGRDWRADLEEAVGLEPTHVSLYGLTAEAGAPLGRWVNDGKVALAGEDRYVEEYLLASEVLGREGYEHYEVSNFARRGKVSRHNAVYWAGLPYAALGPGAHAFAPPLREWNLRSWSAYREALHAGRRPIDGSEFLDADATDLEQVWLGLRTSTGYDLPISTRDQDLLVTRWVGAGLALRSGSTVRLTTEGWLLLDRLAVDLHEAGPATASAVRRPTAIDAAQPLVKISANPNPHL
ncbi:MAG TPA: radical SAM family heme chaperone HemW [Longimicrobiaceae bacterium]|nr:radical SAM family heme chaperone HemW [Longimicrobiaceae bacterium]